MNAFILIIVFACVALGPELATADDDSAFTFVGEGQKSIPCKCSNTDQCSCCFSTPHIDEKGCLTSKIGQNQIQYDLQVLNLPLISKTVRLSGKHRECTTLKKPLEMLSVCLNIDTVPISFGSSSCAALQFFVMKKVVSTYNMQCIDVRGGGRVSEGGFLNVNKPQDQYFKLNLKFIQIMKNKIALLKKGGLTIN